MFTKVISHSGFWKSVIFLSVMFIIIYNLADFWMVFDFDAKVYVEERFAADQLLRFAFANIFSGFVYGFIVSFFKFRSRIKQQSKINQKS